MKRIALIIPTLILAVAAFLVAILATTTANSRAKPPIVNSYTPVSKCVAAVDTNETRDLSGPPDFGVCNVPRRPLDWINAPLKRYDGRTEISVEFYLAAAEPDVDSSVVAYLYDGHQNVGALADSSTMNLQGGARDATTLYGRVYLTPPRGIHRFWIALESVGPGRSSPVYSGTNRIGGGVVDRWLPSYLRIQPA